MLVECFPGIKTDELHRVIDKRDLGSPATVINHVGTNNMRTTINLDFVMGEVYAFCGYCKEENPQMQTFPEWSVAT
jgi:hypothetical protein